MFEKILNLYQQKQYQKIIELVDNSTDEDRVLELKGISALMLKDFMCAYEVFKKLCSQHSTPMNHYHLGLASMQLFKYEDATFSFAISQQEGKLKIPSKLNLAHCLFQADKKQESLTILLDITKKTPSILDAWSMLLLQLRDKSKIQLLQQTINKSKHVIGNTDEWNKANIYLWFNQGEYKKSINGIEIFKLENSEHFRMLKAKSYSKLQQFNRALELYKGILRDNNTALNHYNLAAAYSKLTSKEDLQKSLNYADNCLSLDDNYHQAYYCKALTNQKLNEHNRALIEIEKALKIESENFDYLYIKAETFKHLDRQEECLLVLRKILKKDGNYKEALRLKGIVQLQLNDKARAEETLSQAIKLDTTDQRAIAYFSIAKLAQNKEKEVEEFLGLGNFVKVYTFSRIAGYSDINDFNRSFENDIKSHSLLRKNPNGLAARNGYLTDNLFADKTKSIVVFKKILMQKIKQYIDSLPTNMQHHMLRHKTDDFEINSWATWVKGDGFIDKHIHEESWISGAYYCKVPDITEITTSQEGYFEYGCIPNDIKITIEKERGYIKPEEGKLIIFPSYLYHRTIPHNSQEDRISVAFDLTPKAWKI